MCSWDWNLCSWPVVFSPRLRSPALAGRFFTTSAVWEAQETLETKRLGFHPWVGKIPWRKEWQPTPVLLPGKFHGHRSLAGYSPWGRKESDMTKRLTRYKYSVYFRYKEAKHLDYGHPDNNERKWKRKPLSPVPVLSNSLQPHGLYSQWNSPRKPICKPRVRLENPYP